MDKKTKPQRHKTLTPEELADITPRGASFDTAEGRAAQGMRPDIGNPEDASQDAPQDSIEQAEEDKKLSPEESDEEEER